MSISSPLLILSARSCINVVAPSDNPSSLKSFKIDFTIPVENSSTALVLPRKMVPAFLRIAFVFASKNPSAVPCTAEESI